MPRDNSKWQYFPSQDPSGLQGVLMPDIQFVSQTGTKEDDRETRKFIRRHVMLGKNQGRASNPRQSKITGCAIFRKDDWERTSDGTSTADNQPIQSVIPPRVGSDLSFVEFADDVELPLMNDTLRFCTVTDKELFLLEPCIRFSSTDADNSCLQSLSCDVLHVNIMVFGTQTYMDQIFWQTTSRLRKSSERAVLRHYGKCLSLLRERLLGAERQQSEISDVTIMSVITLAVHALVTEGSAKARHHVVGLQRLLNTRTNGVYSFKSQAKHMIEILRCDIFLSLATGQAPLFFSDSSREPIFLLPELKAQDNAVGRHFTITDDELARVWDILCQFCAMINKATGEQGRVSDEILLETVASVMYRVLNVSFTTSSTDELMRLAVVSFCASVLLPWRQLRMPFSWLQTEYKCRLVDFTQSCSSLANPSLTLWCWLTYGIAFSPFSAEENEKVQSELAKATSLCELASWDNVKSVVNKFPWINLVCDPQAQKLIEKSLARQITAIDVLTMPF